MEISPTAYSTIFWHFTGAPKFREEAKINKPNDMIDPKNIKKEKTDREAVGILKKILDDHKLLATSRENIIRNIHTKAFCCVCDLPIQDLKTHSKYYGNVAVGFSSKSIYKKFNPVLYINREKLELVKEICNSEKVNGKLSKIEETIWSSEFPVDDLSNLQLSSEQFKNYIKITIFNEDTKETFYREKEWRCLEDYKFKNKDVSAIIVPKKYISDMGNYLTENNYKNISIISWEFIKKS